MNWARHLLIIGLLFSTYTTCWCQQRDSTSTTLGVDLRKDTVLHLKDGRPYGTVDSPYKVDSATRKKHDPRKATLYSAVCPGLGQFYNKKYWKLPLVAAAIGIPIYTYFYNKGWFVKCQYALSVLADTPVTPAKLATVDPKLQVFVNLGDINDLLNYRNSFRQDEDYSVLFFLIFWGLNVVDATVDAHLRDFDVSNNLSMRLEPSPTPSASGFAMSNTTGLSLVFDIHKARFKPIPLP
jgi:hypothetical protein